MRKRFAIWLAEKWLGVSWIKIRYKNRHDVWLEGYALVSKKGLPVWGALLNDNAKWLTLEKIK